MENFEHIGQVIDVPIADCQQTLPAKGLKELLAYIKMNELGSQVVPREIAASEALRSHLKAEIDRWTPVIRKTGVYVD